MRCIAASHNIMDGRRIFQLIPHYKRLGNDGKALGICCIQEDIKVFCSKSTFASHILAACLGPQYQILKSDDDPRLAIIFNNSILDPLGDPITVNLPQLAALPRWNKLFINGGKVEQKRGLICDFSSKLGCTNSEKLRVVNFHLDAAGDNHHRLNQFEYLCKAISTLQRVSEEKSNLRYILAGDTNIFHLSTSTQQDCLKHVVTVARKYLPLDSNDLDTRTPTHWFSRADEPMLVKQCGVFLGKYLGLDLPQCYDIILMDSKSLPDRTKTILTADCSDHDIVHRIFSLN